MLIICFGIKGTVRLAVFTAGDVVAGHHPADSVDYSPDKGQEGD
jgi:hypothetical protein